MNKILSFLILATCLPLICADAGAIKIGGFSPSAIDGAGFIIGGEYGKSIDEAFDIGVSLDWFSKEWEDEKAYQDTVGFNDNVNFEDKEKLSETSVNEFPLMINLTLKFPVADMAKVYLTGGFGGELLVISSYHLEVNDDNNAKPVEESDFAFDWNWRAGAGVSYSIGSRSDVFGETVFHYSVPGYEYDLKTDEGKKTLKREYDMKGMLFRAGIRFYFLILNI